MNKRLPLILSLVGVILLAASLAYWILQLYQPPQRPLAAVPRTAMADPTVDAAATLFGGQIAVASATNYQLTGIVSAGRDSAAIIVAEGSPPKALRIGKELAPGVTLAEVHPRYVMLSDGGVMKRIDLATDAKAAAPMGGAPMNAPGVQQPGFQPQNTSVPVSAQPMPAQEPPMAPGAVAQQQQRQQQGGFTSPGDVGGHDNPPPANPNSIVTQGAPGQVQMPASAQPAENNGAPGNQ
jgi:general secretion pathway protein C